MTPEQIEYRETIKRLIDMREMCREIFRKTLEPDLPADQRPSRDQIQAANALLTHCRQEGMDIEILRQQDQMLSELAALRNPERSETPTPEPTGEQLSSERKGDIPTVDSGGNTGSPAVAGHVQVEPKAQT